LRPINATWFQKRFLTEPTLDPPPARSDEAGSHQLDEDYLILSTVHSAKGQEGDNASLLNVVDGTFPNEFATDDPDALEGERRLRYVEMTRAKRELHVIEPVRFSLIQQHRYGDRPRIECETGS